MNPVINKNLVIFTFLVGIFISLIVLGVLYFAIESDRHDANTDQVRARVCQELTPELRPSCLIAAR